MLSSLLVFTQQYLTVMALMSVMVFAGSMAVISSDIHTLPPGVVVNGVEARGMTVSQLRESLTNLLADEVIIQLVDDTGSVVESLTLETREIGVLIPLDVVYQEVATFLEPTNQLTRRLAFRSTVHTQEIPPQYDQSALHRWAEQVAQEVSSDPVNARYEIVDGRPAVVPEQLGTMLDSVSLVGWLQRQWSFGYDPELTYEVSRNKPDMLASDLPDFTSLIAQFSTLVTENHNREKNIALANQYINGTVLKPSEIFSFNNTVQHATAERGFLPATVIMRQRLVTDYGGGICQVSSTLYQAALRAKLPIVERRNHSLPVNYMPLGLDAAVSYNQLDLRFENPYPYPLMLVAWSAENTMQAAIYGPQEHTSVNIDIVPRHIQVFPFERQVILDDTIPKGMETVEHKGSSGYQVTVYRVTYLDDGTAHEEVISVDSYAAIDEVIRIGTGIVSVKP